MKVAHKVKDMTGWRGDASIYKLEPAYDGNQFVIVSAINNEFGRETFIFPSDGEDVLDFGELEGSERYTLSHEKVLNNIGYRIEG